MPPGPGTGAWDAILPGRRPPVVLAAAVLVTTLAQASADPIAFMLGPAQAWPTSLSFPASLAILIVMCVVQAAALLLTTRWATAALISTFACYAATLFVLDIQSWVAPMQLAIVAALFLLATRCGVLRALITLALTIAAQATALVIWATGQGLTAGVALSFLSAQSIAFSAAFSAATALGIWWGRQARHLAEMRAIAEAERREQEERLERAREAERARIAQELHDVAAQHITGLVSLTDAALTIADENPHDALELLDDVRSEGRFAAASLFAALSELRATGQAKADATPDASDIDDLVEFWHRRDVHVEVRRSGDLGDLPAVISTTVYRIVQEALTNAAKHAPGAGISVEIAVAGQNVVVTVANAAPQRVLADAPPSGFGWGISGLRERVELLGGRLDAGPTADGGWLLQAMIPVNAAAPAAPEGRHLP